jgi:hypothetical protein
MHGEYNIEYVNTLPANMVTGRKKRTARSGKMKWKEI